MPLLENRLTWSKSRAETFGWCLRKYWWTYYGAWGGWASDAPRETREAYVLKNLHSRWTWVGDAVHRAIERVLRGLLAAATAEEGLALEGGTAVDPDAETERLTRSMRSQFRESREGRYRADPKRSFGLVEHEYGVPVADTEWKEMNRRAVDGLRGFLGSRLFADLAASDPRTWLPIETLDSFDFEGTPVWASLDFGRRVPSGAEVYDWKTGEERVEANTLQVQVYAMYVEAKHGVPATAVTGRLVYVNTGAVHAVPATPAALDAARTTMRESIGAMREKLRMGGGSEPSMLAFPMTDDRDRCASCAFRRLCGR
ncbi:MAG: PD-(D/E)XK nuclease family protein [Planctomycetes bacterium]|nr:PD-(D/E)XK nuclease family protein [Planctomycetota bacterium]